MGESQTVGVRMAKATAADLDAAYELSNLLEQLQRGNYPATDDSEDGPRYFDVDNTDHQQFLHRRLLEIERRGSLFRVVGGLDALLAAENAIVDPDVSHLAMHPRLVHALTANANRFQQRVRPWILECFGQDIAGDMTERGDRFLEEVIELLQAHGYDRERIPALVDYVYSRPAGEPAQEVGGVMVTLAAYCGAAGIDMHAAGDAELARVWTMIPQIREKQASKAGVHSPLPGGAP